MASSASSDFGTSKVCFICCCLPEGTNDCQRIYVVDFYEDSTPEFTHRSPTLRINSKYFDRKGICVLGSKLYLFDSPGLLSPYGGRLVFTYELPQVPVSNLKLKKTDLVAAPPLNYAKFGLATLPTPDGKKLLVFSTRIQKLGYGEDEASQDFELYDPKVGLWRTLTGITAFWRRESSITIEAYSFVKNVLILQTKNFGFFGLDVESSDPIALNLHDFSLTPPRIRGYGHFVTIDSHDLYLLPHLAYDVVSGRYLEYPELSYMGDNYKDTTRYIRLLHHVEHQECKFCVSQVEVSIRSRRPYLFLNLYRLDLEEYAQEIKKRKNVKILPGTMLMKSFKFRLDVESLDNSFYGLNLHAIH